MGATIEVSIALQVALFLANQNDNQTKQEKDHV